MIYKNKFGKPMGKFLLSWLSQVSTEENEYANFLFQIGLIKLHKRE